MLQFRLNKSLLLVLLFKLCCTTLFCTFCFSARHITARALVFSPLPYFLELSEIPNCTKSYLLSGDGLFGKEMLQFSLDGLSEEQ